MNGKPTQAAKRSLKCPLDLMQTSLESVIVYSENFTHEFMCASAQSGRLSFECSMMHHELQIEVMQEWKQPLCCFRRLFAF